MISSSAEFIAQFSQTEFQRNQHNISQATTDVGLTPDNGIVIGTGGLALHGLDAHVDSPNAFDMDVVAGGKLFEDYCAELGAPLQAELHLPLHTTVLPVTLLKTPLSNNLANGLGAQTFDELKSKQVVVNGVPTLPAVTLAAAKLRGGNRPKDIAGIIKAHVIAYESGHEIIDNEEWNVLVGAAMHTATWKAHKERGLFKTKSLPSWLGALARKSFSSHSAFDIPASTVWV